VETTCFSRRPVTQAQRNQWLMGSSALDFIAFGGSTRVEGTHPRGLHFLRFSVPLCELELESQRAGGGGVYPRGFG
jgi:hypothetical protein